ncbi:hypothetical protein ES711_14190 [Gelidibacter salicanalis]|uniref:Uncharacterized protein n=1 Tax=Gelidibacter salicanalis TaxID=291193 RepID=A0A5C7AEU1_9FLAO|nr:hypothetical protein [Gelidibacter salicanalis]TXE05983.1 hypothetical protein ES711_14190 [Gelidibacter salicanalis]
MSNKLLKEGWHRKEIDQLMQFYIQQNSGIGSKKDQEFAPLPAPNLWKHIKFSKFKDYLKTNLKAYEDFKTKFPETDPTYPITYSSITEP